MDDEKYMTMALREAMAAGDNGEVPVGAVIVHGGKIVGKAFNQVEMLRDPTAHAEILAITQAAAALGDWRLTDTVLYVTKEPCAMCAGAIVMARIPRVVFGTRDPQRGGAVSVFNILKHPNLNHRSDVVEGVLEEQCRELLTAFFKKRRTAERS